MTQPTFTTPPKQAQNPFSCPLFITKLFWCIRVHHKPQLPPSQKKKTKKGSVGPALFSQSSVGTLTSQAWKPIFFYIYIKHVTATPYFISFFLIFIYFQVFFFCLRDGKGATEKPKLPSFATYSYVTVPQSKYIKSIIFLFNKKDKTRINTIFFFGFRLWSRSLCLFLLLRPLSLSSPLSLKSQSFHWPLAGLWSSILFQVCMPIRSTRCGSECQFSF